MNRALEPFKLNKKEQTKQAAKGVDALRINCFIYCKWRPLIQEIFISHMYMSTKIKIIALQLAFVKAGIARQILKQKF